MWISRLLQPQSANSRRVSTCRAPGSTSVLLAGPWKRKCALSVRRAARSLRALATRNSCHPASLRSTSLERRRRTVNTSHQSASTTPNKVRSVTPILPCHSASKASPGCWTAGWGREGAAVEIANLLRNHCAHSRHLAWILARLSILSQTCLVFHLCPTRSCRSSHSVHLRHRASPLVLAHPPRY